MKKLGLILGLVAIGAAAVWYGGGKTVLDRITTTASNGDSKDAPLGNRDLGVHYRMTAKYTYKGEPLVLDFGISCGSIWENPKQHKYSMDVFAGPVLYGVATKDGKVVVISTANYCDTLKPKEPNWGAPEDFLPITLVYNDPDTLVDAIMYASDEAYHNPNSVLTEPKVRFQRLTAKALLELRKTQVPNAVRSKVNAGRQQADHKPSRSKHPIQSGCYGWMKIDLTEKGREELRKIWPSSRPDYWMPLGRDVTKAMWNLALLMPGMRMQERYAGVSGRGSGLNRSKSGGAVNMGGGIGFALPYYPQVLKSGPRWDGPSSQWIWQDVVYDIPTAGDAQRGFLSCMQAVYLAPPIPLGRKEEASIEAGRKEFLERIKHARLTVDGQAVVDELGNEIRRWPEHFLAVRDEAIFESVWNTSSYAGEQGDE